MSSLKLTCQACAYANEPERVYCHNCGAKLDRSSLPKEDPKRDVREAKRVRSLVKPKNPVIAIFVRGVVETVIFAAFAAFLALSFWPPAKLPPAPTDEERLTAPQINLVLERALAMPTAQTLKLDEKMVNAYIAGRIRSKPTELFAGLKTANEFVLVTFKNKLVNLTVKNIVASIPIHFTVSYDLAIKNNALVATNKGGALGRAPIHPFLMNSIEQLIYPTIWKALAQEEKLLGLMQTITVEDGHITLVTTPGRLAL